MLESELDEICDEHEESQEQVPRQQLISARSHYEYQE